jgi:UDP-N-acetylmuramoyl-tripeptide--D-alanyl-D-alanine ligase
MLIMAVVAAIVSIAAFFLVMRYNLHMLQLNGYKNGEHMHWLRENAPRQWYAVLLVLPCVLVAFGCGLLACCISIVCCVICIFVYNYYRKKNTKKRLVYTARCRRLVATDVVLCVIVLVISGVFAPAALVPVVVRLTAVCNLLAFLQVFALVAANVINRPIEKAVGDYYINDAKKMLAENQGLTVIGVTGSYGKTSVKFYLQTLLSTRYNVLVTPESFNTPMGVVRTIRESLKSTHEIFVCEMGARHVGDIKEICDIVHPRHGVITSVGPQHLETFFNMDNIKNTKFELADALPKDGMLFLNGDNEYIQDKADGYGNKIFYHAGAVQASGGYRATNLRVSQTGTDFTVVTPDGGTCDYHMRLVGAHNVINVVGAIAVANSLGIPMDELKIPVRRLEAVPHRLQMTDHGTFTIIDDAYNSNPVGSKAAVETLAMFDGLRILVTPGMVELGEQEEHYNYLFGTYAAKCCDYILLVGARNAAAIMKGALENGFAADRCRTFDTLQDAMKYTHGITTGQHKFILLENDLPDNY